MLRRESDSHGLFSSGETSDNDCEMEASCGEVDVVCLCEAGPCTLYSEAHTPTPDTLLCEHCGKNRVMITRYSEGYGTEEDCVLSDPQGESDADADIEDTDCRLQEPGSLQRISSRRRKRPRVARQDTTESEDDGGRSHRSHRWNLRLSPDRAHSRTILEESISQVRPLVICRPNVERQRNPVELSRGSKCLMSLWPSSLSLPLILLLLLPLSLSLVIVIMSFLLPWASA
ncbi:uncharacterized protein si:ch211-63p21.1 isoform X1 [Thunnus albacares]|uniref:uncharacterized protein si:ch211-63p21.1 n=2 Tax=Thunnus TaxID=8234 RepID=UPI001C4CAD1E|nr:uncharacterized protein si:ch211-63p21.1 [Thunnus maccoyii]XP_042256343.1 uncharacterized protein si:ch211-63p21.1 [Thunnus maccoyii]XP_044197783.1 uncharacterized protein si:ch211-63p21.1 isoform X1 [Thunnus albacares]XP_044197784.1 uncharacterized protein si:ch211-63p21.1 isoform X1 [Thunnus albacares]